MVNTFAEALISADADALCGAGYGVRSQERVNLPALGRGPSSPAAPEDLENIGRCVRPCPRASRRVTFKTCLR